MSRVLVHAQLPWYAAGHVADKPDTPTMVYDAMGMGVAVVVGTPTRHFTETAANVRLIVRACNHHSELVAALRAIIAADADYKREIADVEAAGVTFDDPLEDALKEARDLLKKLEA
jgi:hypothetical protein